MPLALLWLLAIAAALSHAPAAPAPKERPVVQCELVTTRKVGDLECPDAGFVTISNLSDGTIDIGSTVGPLGCLDLEIQGPQDAKPTAYSVAHRFAPFFGVRPHPLKPGESCREPLSLLFDVPAQARVDGIYRVKAIAKYDGKRYESAWVEVKWPGERK